MQDDEAQGATQGELPYELLRRAANYEVYTYAYNPYYSYTLQMLH
jgi:hypothetical protein